MNKPEKLMSDLDHINLLLENASRTTLLVANAATRVAGHAYYPTKDAYQQNPDGSYTESTEFREWSQGLQFELAQSVQNLAVMWQIQQHQLRQQLKDRGLISDVTPDIPSCSVAPDGTLVIGGSC